MVVFSVSLRKKRQQETKVHYCFHSFIYSLPTQQDCVLPVILTVATNPRSKTSLIAPGPTSHRSAVFVLSFSCFWMSVIEIEVLNEED